MSCGVHGLPPRAAAALRVPHRCGGFIPSRRREGQGGTTTTMLHLHLILRLVLLQ